MVNGRLPKGRWGWEMGRFKGLRRAPVRSINEADVTVILARYSYYLRWLASPSYFATAARGIRPFAKSSKSISVVTP
jgi:hypothetical protein